MPAAALWPVDPLVKVFQDAAPPESAPRPPVALAVRNEYVSLQFVLRAEEELTHLRARVHAIGAPTVRFVGFVPLRANTPKTPLEELLRKAPGRFPDPLLLAQRDRLEPNTSLPIWITVRVPADAPVGHHLGRLLVECDQGAIERPFGVRVAAARLPDERTLWVTNWFRGVGSRMKQFHGVEDWTPEHWELLRTYARMMAAYRQNVVLTPLYQLIEFTAGPDGALRFGFDRFDRWVRLFQEEGVIGRIEGSHLGSRKGWTAPQFDVRIRVVQDGKVVAKTAHPDEPETEAFLRQFLPALQDHLAQRGWLDMYLQHLCDEPIEPNAESYRTLAALVARHGPKLQRIDANHYRELVGSLDVWVPQLNYYHDSVEFYQRRQKSGDEVWFYTCLNPKGTYPNRFIDYSLLKTRLLHWLNFRFGATGYLHWGWNQWSVEDPFADVQPPHGSGFLPPGDGWIVYPAPDGGLLSSIRFEALRDGIEDYELLRLLREKRLALAQDLARRMAPDMAHPNTDIAAFRQARRELIEALSR